MNFDKTQVPNIGIPQGLNKYARSKTNTPSLTVSVIRTKIPTMTNINAMIQNIQAAIPISIEKIPMKIVSKNHKGAKMIFKKSLPINPKTFITKPPFRFNRISKQKCLQGCQSNTESFFKIESILLQISS